MEGRGNNFRAIIPCESYNKEVTFINWYKNDLALNVLFACVFYFVQHFHKEDNIFNQHVK